MLFLTTNQAAAQSTDTCTQVSGFWYKWSIADSTAANDPDRAYNFATPLSACQYSDAIGGIWPFLPETWTNMQATTGSDSRCRGTLPNQTIGNWTQTGHLNRHPQPNPVTDCPTAGAPTVQSDDGCEKIGNPCMPATGAKYAKEVDYTSTTGIDFSRYYSSKPFPVGMGPLQSAFASAQWMHTYERTIRVLNPATNGGIKWAAIRPDGVFLYFRANGTEQLNRSDTLAGSVLTPITAAGGGWDLKFVNGDVERYNHYGRLTSITTRSGLVITVTYDASSRILKVANSFGHDLDFFYDAQSRLYQVRDPANGIIQYSYDASGRLEYVTYQDLTQRRYHYEHAVTTLLTGVTDENGIRFATYDYDAQGRVTATEHAGGAGRYEFSYTGASAPYTTTVEDPLNTSRTYTFGNVNNVYKLQTITGPACSYCGSAQQTLYDANGNVSQRTDFEGNVTTYIFGSPRNLESSRTEAYGTPRARTIATLWHATYRLPTQVDEPGRRTTFTHDAAGNVLTKTVLDTATAESRTWTYTYNGFGRVLTENGPRTDVTDVTTNAYYTCSTGTQCGQLNTVTNALSHVTTFNTYNAHGQPLTITDPNGVVTTLTYDARQRLKTRTFGGELTTFDYWPIGLLKKVTLPDSSYLQYAYDNAHRLTGISDSEGNLISYGLDAMGNRTSEQVFDPSSTLTRTRTRVFNSLNQLYQEIGAAGTPAVTTTFAYDNNGNQTGINAPLGRNTSQDYDELDRLSGITDPASGITAYGYNALDQLISVTDPRTLVTNYTYNALGDLKQQVSPDTGTTNNTYDTGGNLKTSTDARSKVGTYSYDALNRVTSLVFSDQTITYTYDTGTNQKGRLTDLASTGGTESWTYDTKGRVLTKTQVSNGNTKVITYHYNSVGQLDQITTPNSNVIVYGYTNGKVSSITVNGTTLLNSVVYEPFGPVGGWTWGNSTLAVRTYDLDGRVDLIDSAGLRDYAWDNASRITDIVDTNSALNQSYGYDNLDRLTSVTKSSGNQSFTYDANGNRLTYSDGAASSTYVIAGTSNRLTSITGSQARTYAFNAVGNVTSYGSITLAYSDRERAKSATVSGSTWNYYLNGLGERVRKGLSPSGNNYYVYDESGHLIGEYNGNTLIQETVWLGDIPVATLRPKTGGVDIFYVHTDHLNAPRKVTRPSDNGIRWSWDRAPFGTTAPNENPSGLGTFTYNLRLPGQFYDAETGLNYNYFRDYDPAIGKYVQSDPVGLGGGINTYAYTGSDPVRFIDPFGLKVLNPKGYPVSSDVMEALWEFNRLIGCDKDIVITGGDRPRGSKLGARDNSPHVRKLAADIFVPGQLHLVTANQAIKSGLFGGVGWYEEGYRGPNNEGPHTHVDLPGQEARRKAMALGSSRERRLRGHPAVRCGIEPEQLWVRTMISKSASRMVTLLMCVCGTGACAQDFTPETFEKSFFAPIQISSFSLEPKRLNRLTDDQKRQLLIARSVVGEFFVALEDVNGDPLRFVTADYARRVLNRLSLRQSLISEETAILRLAVRDYTLSDDARTLELELYVTVFSEGAFAVNEVRCSLQRTTESWQIADVAISS
jgi:RHS repeat-associated protein